MEEYRQRRGLWAGVAAEGRQWKCGGVEHYGLADPLRVPGRPGESDHPAPVMHDQSQRLVQVQVAEQLFQVGHPLLQRI